MPTAYGPKSAKMHLSVKKLSLEGSYKQQTYFGQSMWDVEPSSEPPESKWKDAAVHTAKQYCFTAVLHGVKYLAEPRRPIIERIAWSIALVSLVAVALHLLWITSISELNSPLLINLESSNHPIWHFNFPAVTICPSSKLNRSESENWARTVKLPPGLTAAELVELLPNLLHLIDFEESSEQHMLHGVLELNKVKAHELYLNLSVQCQDLLVQCRLSHAIVPCYNLFKTIRTTEGYCCSFNYFGVSSKFMLNRYHNPAPVTPKAPLRLSSNGKNSGLSVLLRTKGNTFGTMMSSQGVKVLIHISTNYPDHLAIERLVQPGQAEHFALTPAKIGAGTEVRNIPQVSRNCYFYDEKNLTGFQEYSYSSCNFNCRIGFFVSLCGCIPFYYPTHADGIRTCSLKDVGCLAKFKYEIQALRMNVSLEMGHSESPPCGCRPQCNELSYSVAAFDYSLQSQLKTYQYGELTDFDTLSEINIYFKALFGTRSRRVQQSTTHQMLANFGGLMGLFMGFSFIAAFELIYAFTLRICFQVYVTYKSKKESDLEETQVEAYSPY